jgi:hypothetical protein
MEQHTGGGRRAYREGLATVVPRKPKAATNQDATRTIGELRKKAAESAREGRGARLPATRRHSYESLKCAVLPLSLRRVFRNKTRVSQPATGVPMIVNAARMSARATNR